MLLRAVALLDRVASGETQAVAPGAVATQRGNPRRQAVQTAGLVCSVALLMTVTGEQVRGATFTAEVVLMAVAATETCAHSYIERVLKTKELWDSREHPVSMLFSQKLYKLILVPYNSILLSIQRFATRYIERVA